MVIRRIEVIPFAIPLRVPMLTARGPITHREGWLVRLHDDAGRVGVGEATPHPAATPAARATTRTTLGDAARWLSGADIARLDALLAATGRLDRAAAAGIDVALHDLVGRATGRPVAALLGGARREAVEASALIDAGPPEACAYAAARALARGFRCVKMKIDRDIERSVARLRAARTAAPELDIRADANGCLDAAAAIAIARRLRDLPLDWLEQPVPAGDIAALRAVREAGDVRVAADEGVDGPAAVALLAGAADVVVLKLVQTGGLARAVATARAATHAGLETLVTTAIDTGVGTAAALHLGLALDDPPPCGVATAGLLAGDLIVERLADGPAMAPPPGPGLGVTIDAAALARWRVAEAA